MKPLTNLMVLAVACCGPLTAGAAEQRFTCPERLAPETIQPNHPPAGWTMYMPRGARLVGGGMLHGAPDQSGYMVPDDTKLTKSGKSSTQTDRWAFHAPEGYPTWIYCGYGGAGAPLQLFKRIADDATQCTLTAKSTDERTKQMVEFVCK